MFISFIARSIGNLVLLGFAGYGFSKAAGKVWEWKKTHDTVILLPPPVAPQA